VHWDEQKVLLNIRQADDDDLLDRITAFRSGMEPDAIAMVEQELHRRGVSAAQIVAHEEACRRECVFEASGVARSCSLCRKPAVCDVQSWYKLFWLIPLIPRTLWLCKDHAAKTSATPRHPPA
jgi:hypothetical protein